MRLIRLSIIAGVLIAALICAPLAIAQPGGPSQPPAGGPGMPPGGPGMPPGGPGMPPGGPGMPPGWPGMPPGGPDQGTKTGGRDAAEENYFKALSAMEQSTLKSMLYFPLYRGASINIPFQPKRISRSLLGCVGPVETVHTSTSRYSVKNGLFGADAPIEGESFTFNEKGLVLEYNMPPIDATHPLGHLVREYRPDGQVMEEIRSNDEGEQIQRLFLTYDTDGRLLTSNLFKGKDDELVMQRLSLYDIAGRMVEEQISAADGALMGSEKHFYSASGLRIKTLVLSKTGNIDSEITFAYDGKGRRISEIKKTKATNTLLLKATAAYNASGAAIKETNYAYGKTVGNVTSMYNGRDMLTSIAFTITGDKHPVTGKRWTVDVSTKVTYNSRNHPATLQLKVNKLSGSYKYSYVYDQKGNWIKQTRFKEIKKGGAVTWQIDEVNERDIVYYALDAPPAP